MKREHARSAILFMWKDWRHEHLDGDRPASEADAQRFMTFLEAERPNVMAFDPVEDKHRDILSWLKGMKLVQS